MIGSFILWSTFIQANKLIFIYLYLFFITWLVKSDVKFLKKTCTSQNFLFWLLQVWNFILLRIYSFPSFQYDLHFTKFQLGIISSFTIILFFILSYSTNWKLHWWLLIALTKGIDSWPVKLDQVTLSETIFVCKLLK